MTAAPSRLPESRRLPVVIVLVATLLATTSLSGGRTLDDWVLAVVARGQGPALGLPSERWDCFRFTTGDPRANQGLMDRGVLLPWWTARELKIAFFRPLSALTHQLDEALWPNSPVALHAQSLFWFAALLVLVWKVYQRLVGERRQANLAFALYAFDDAHGATVGWIANRNALLSVAFGCACLWAHDGWRRAGSRFGGGLPLALFALSCLAGELGAATLAYLIAYAVFLDRSALKERVRSLLGYAVWCTVWRAGWSWGGYGARGSGAYADPFTEPVEFITAAPRKWLSLLQGQLGIVPSDLSFVGSAAEQRLWIFTALATLIAAVLLLRPGLDDPRERFWLGGALLALLPMAASFPSDRLLLFVGLGMMPPFARAFLRAWDELSRAGRLRAKVTTANALALGFFAIHGLLAPLLLPLRAGQMGLMARAEQEAFRQLAGAAGPGTKNLIVLNAPSLLLASYAQFRLDARRRAPFASIYVLSATDSAVDVTRTGAGELTLHAALGFLHSPLERHYRGSAAAPFDHGRVWLAGLGAEIMTSSADGRPASVRFTLRRDPADYAFECWTEGSFRRCELPALGKTMRLAPADLGRILLGERAKP